MVMSVKEQWRLHSDESGATSWEQFEQFINNYVDPEGDRGSRAAYRILTERQKNSRVREWGARCQEIWPRLEEKEFHVQLFIETLNNNLQREIARSSPKPRSLQEAIDLAVRFESVLFREKKRDQHTEPKKASTGNNEPTAKRCLDDGEESPRALKKPATEPKPLGARVSQGPSKDTRDKLRFKQRKEGRCFNCDQTGHLSANCPQRTEAETAPTKEESQ
jgi:hypothetical protein